MNNICFNKWLYSFLLSTMLSFTASAITHEKLIERAESGSYTAQVELAIAYKEKQQFDQSHYWLIKSALQGHSDAFFLLGNMFEFNNDSHYNTLPLALNWYRLGMETNHPEAELGYTRILEKQFNNHRMKQISSIAVMNEQIDKEAQTLSSPEYSTTHHERHQVRTNTFFITSLSIILLFCSTLYLFIKQWVKRKSGQKVDNLQNKILEQNKQIKLLQRHLAVTHRQLKKNQKNNLNQEIAIACATLGFSPNHIPNEKEVKSRYKKLSRIYHPDNNGDEEEMKRLNAAIKLITASYNI